MALGTEPSLEDLSMKKLLLAVMLCWAFILSPALGAELTLPARPFLHTQ
jgi:hypothetical protein